MSLAVWAGQSDTAASLQTHAASHPPLNRVVDEEEYLAEALVESNLQQAADSTQNRTNFELLEETVT